MNFILCGAELRTLYFLIKIIFCYRQRDSSSYNTWSQFIDSYSPHRPHRLERLTSLQRCSVLNTENVCSSTAVQQLVVSTQFQSHRHRPTGSFHAGKSQKCPAWPHNHFDVLWFQGQQQLGNKLLNSNEIKRELVTIKQEATRVWWVSSWQSGLLMSAEERTSGNWNRRH